MAGNMLKENAPSQETAPAESAVSPSFDEKTVQEKRNHFKLTQKISEILSSQYGINLFLAGLFLMFAGSLNLTRSSKQDIQCYLIAVMFVQMLWMLWYILRTKSQKNSTKEKDSHAGARWLRCGIALFAGIAVILDALKLGYYLGYSECLSRTEAVFPVTHAVHTLIQVFFLWFHSKDIIQSFKTIERFALIHSVFTNLLLWASEVFTESKHQLLEHMDRLSTLGFENITLEVTIPECNCTTGVCSAFSKAINYLYPFNIEYHILASAMLYVLWKNIGSKMKSHHGKQKCDFHGIAPGSASGLVVLAFTIAATVAYFMLIGRSKFQSELALSIYYLYCTLLLGIMTLTGVVGLATCKTGNRKLIDAKSPAIQLDAELLVGSSCGTWIMSWGSILAIIYSDSHPVYTWYNLPYSIILIIQKYIQNVFIIEYIHRKLEEPWDNDTLTRSSVATIPCESPLFPDPPFELLYSESFKAEKDPFPDMDIFKPPLEEIRTVFQNEKDPNENQVMNEKSVNNEKNYFTSPPLCDPTNEVAKAEELSKRRRILRNITVFLFLCNISLWIPQAFGCRPQYDNGLEEYVFGFRPWIILIDIALPFSIFYRMHSMYSLFDVYIKI
ncbi:proton channel OTOP1-like [Lissotriton helveticus]